MTIGAAYITAFQEKGSILNHIPSIRTTAKQITILIRRSVQIEKSAFLFILSAKAIIIAIESEKVKACKATLSESRGAISNCENKDIKSITAVKL